jgi:hypothetical protein
LRQHCDVIGRVDAANRGAWESRGTAPRRTRAMTKARLEFDGGAASHFAAKSETIVFRLTSTLMNDADTPPTG